MRLGHRNCCLDNLRQTLPSLSFELFPERQTSFVDLLCIDCVKYVILYIGAVGREEGSSSFGKKPYWGISSRSNERREIGAELSFNDFSRRIKNANSRRKDNGMGLHSTFKLVEGY